MMKVLARIGESGFVHNIPTGQDLSSIYTSAEIHYKDPDGNVTDKTCDVVDASTGDFGWTVTSGFFDEAGRWEAQLTVTTTAGPRKLAVPIVFWIGEDGE